MPTTHLLAALLVAVGSTAALAQEAATPKPRLLPAQPAAQPQAKPAKQHSPDAVAVLQAAAEAVKEGYTANVRSYFEGSGPMAAIMAKSQAEGRWAQRALGEENQWAVRYTGQAMAITRAEPIDFDVLWLPDRNTWIDHEAQELNIQPNRGRQKTGEAYQLASGPWGQAKPLATGFADILKNAAIIEIRDPADINGTRCDVVAITRKADSDPTIWYFGRQDHLPRRSEIVLPDNPELSGAFRVDFTDGLAGADVVSEDDWTIEAPSTYKKNIARAFLDANRPGDNALRPSTKPAALGLPDWEVPDSEGNLVSPGSLHGKVSVLYFWGTWSPACKKTTPEVKALAEAYADQPVEIISMAFREDDAEAVVAAARAQGQTWRQVPAADDAMKVIGVRSAPAIVVLGQQGELLYKSGRPKGDYTEMFTRIRAIIDRALAEPTTDANNAGQRAPAAVEGRKATPNNATRLKPGKPRLKKKED